MVHGETSFGEVFDAAVGQVFDEELSISSALNNEGYDRRNALLKESVAKGFDARKYQDSTGVIDFDRMAEETDFGIKTDLELYEERNALLASRRAYSQDVIERGSGMAQFLGAMTGYMLDPVNVVTLPIGASASALRGLSTMARVKRVMATEAVIGGAAETLIQPFVYAHKNEIGSPYEISDSVAAIASAAIGGAAIGGAASGIAGFIRSAAKIDAPNKPEVLGAREILNRVANDIEANPERFVQSEKLGKSARKFFQMDNEELSQQIILMKRAELDEDGVIALEAAEAVFESRKGRWATTVEAERQNAIRDEIESLRIEEETRLPRGERKAIGKRIQELNTARNAVTEAEPVIVKKKGVPARKAKIEAQRAVELEAEAKRAEYQAEIDELQARLDSSKPGEAARADLSRVQQGVFPQRLQEALNKIEHRRMIEIDANYLRKLEETRLAQMEPQRAPADFIAPEVEGIAPRTDDLDAMIDADIERFARIEAGDDAVNDVILAAKQQLDELDELAAGLESVRVCNLG
jgi:hypothetical protein